MIEFDLVNAIRLGGVLQLSILIASSLVPGVLDWRHELKRLSPMTRQLVWVHGAFLVLTIFGMAVIALISAATLARGDSTLARAVCGFVAFFWLARLSLQFALFDATPYFDRRILKIGYRSLTFVFSYLVITFGWAALKI